MRTITVTHNIEVGGYEFPVQIEIDYQPEETEERYYPGCPEGVDYSVSMFGQELDFYHPIVRSIPYDIVLELYHENHL